MNIINPIGLNGVNLRIVFETCHEHSDTDLIGVPGINNLDELPPHTLHFMMEGIEPRGLAAGVLTADGSFHVAPFATIAAYGSMLQRDNDRHQHDPEIEFLDADNLPDADQLDEHTRMMAYGPDGNLMPVPPQVIAKIKEAIRNKQAGKEETRENRDQPGYGQYL